MGGGSGYVIPVDPCDLNRFAGSDPRFDEEDDNLTPEELEELALTEEEMLQLREINHARVTAWLNSIPDCEADIIHLYFFLGKRQADIAEIFKMTQAAVSYRLTRGIQRIKFLLAMPDVSEDDMRRDLGEVFSQPIDVDILVGMWSSTCQSEVAIRLGLTQGRVRHRFFKAVERLKTAAGSNPKYSPYSEIFTMISSKKFNILREVKLPQWADRGSDELA